MNNKLKSCTIKCDSRFVKQCTSAYGSRACKIRFNGGRCLMALKLKEKEVKSK